MEDLLKYWPYALAGLTAFSVGAAWFCKFTKETPWKWDDPIGSVVGKIGAGVQKALDAAKSIVSAIARTKK